MKSQTTHFQMNKVNIHKYSVLWDFHAAAHHEISIQLKMKTRAILVDTINTIPLRNYVWDYMYDLMI